MLPCGLLVACAHSRGRGRSLPSGGEESPGSPFGLCWHRPGWGYGVVVVVGVPRYSLLRVEIWAPYPAFTGTGEGGAIVVVFPCGISLQ